MLNSINKLKRDDFFLGIVLFTLPLSLRLNSLAIILASLYFIYYSIKLKTVKNLKVYIISILFFIAQLFSYFLSDDSKNAESKLVLYLSFLFFPIFFSNLQSRSFFVKDFQLIRWLFYGTITILFYGITRFLFDIIILDVRYDYGRGVALFLKYVPHHVYLSMYILISIYGIIGGVLEFKKNKMYLLAIPFLYLALILLSSRMAIIISVLVLPGLTYFKIRDYVKTKRVKQVFLVLFVLLLVIGFSNDFARDKILHTYYELANIATKEKPFLGVSYRKDVWITSLKLIRNSPWIGYGIGDIQQVLDIHYTSKGLEKLLRLNAHNQYLQLILHHGILISSMLFVALIGVIRKLVNRKLLFLIFCWFVLISFSLTESILNRQWGVVLFALILNYSIYSLQHNVVKKEVDS